MKISFLFPGQGSQYKGIGKNLYNKFDFAKKLFHDANDILEYDLKKICFSNDSDTINETKYTQPAIFIYSMICDYYLKDSNYEPYAFAGHSLGEYSALASSNCLSIEDALKIIKTRSQEMYNSGKNSSGKMAAILSSDYNKINKIINQMNSSAVIANYNSLNQTIISGKIDEIELLIQNFKENKFKIIPLNVSGAFHSPLMNNIKKDLNKVIEKTYFKDIEKPIYQNTNPIKNLNSKIIKENLIKQITSPVKWINIINQMYIDGFSNFIEVGPGSILTKLNKNINSDIICTNFNKLYYE